MEVCLLIYWIILLLVYEKDKKYMVENIDEDYLFEKYNAIMAGCIQGSRKHTCKRYHSRNTKPN